MGVLCETKLKISHLHMNLCPTGCARCLKDS